MANTLFTETLAKYLAGFIDADGSLSLFAIKQNDGTFYPALTFKICQASSIDHNFRLLTSLFNKVKLGRIYIRQNQPGNKADICEWVIRPTNELEMFIPRIAKYLVIKGKHFSRTLEWYRSIKGTRYSQQELKWLRLNLQQSRVDTGPLKPKNYPSSAWLAGYMDGDGCIYIGKRQSLFTISFHKNDMQAPILIQKAFGGHIYAGLWKTNPSVMQYRLTLGGRETLNASGLKLLRYVIPHLQIKKYKVEQLLARHQQRLNEEAPTGEATV